MKRPIWVRRKSVDWRPTLWEVIFYILVAAGLSVVVYFLMTDLLLAAAVFVAGGVILTATAKWVQLGVRDRL